jgi:hypothetical protein
MVCIIPCHWQSGQNLPSVTATYILSIYLDLFEIYLMKVSSPKSLSLDVIRSSHVMCHVTYKLIR